MIFKRELGGVFFCGNVKEMNIILLECGRKLLRNIVLVKRI